MVVVCFGLFVGFFWEGGVGGGGRWFLVWFCFVCFDFCLFFVCVAFCKHVHLDVLESKPRTTVGYL